ncbi:hypothetical protein DY000_02059335 [Brassica cretica]|uniref:Gfo/Idh/MocA-like oxidoreductase C-terminal domain-containing protein n=1 Tax=Brassica cretica TaxID=69181 RepID=A0ABQ7AS61_BRACR|nr:hypothetical protein DY000_02059335 [Brassica cretica]
MKIFLRCFKPKFYKKCKSATSYMKIRLEIVRKRRIAMIKFLKMDIVEFLKNGLDYDAYRRVHSSFSLAGDEDFLKNDIRVKPNLDGLGALGDLGWYAIRAALFANNFELPKIVAASPGTVLNKSGVILSCGASLSWEDGRTATIYFFGKSSFTTCTKAPFMNPWVNRPSEHTVKTEIPQEACMVREFARLVGEIKNKGAEPDGFWPNISRKTQLVVDAIKESVDKNCEQISLSGR